MGTEPVKKLLLTMSLPMMISMLVQALYNIVDSIFVARLSENALTAVTLAFPLQSLMIALASGTGVGINAMLSKSLGEKRFDNSDKAANNGLFLTAMNFALFFIISLTAAGAFISTQTSDAEIIDLGHTYLSIVTGISFGLFFEVTGERLLQSTGRAFYSMITQMTGAITNIIMDPILIFGLFGFPALGVAGAAYATVLGQILAACLAMFFNVKKNTDIHFSLKSVFHPELWVIKRIYFVAVPSILMMAIGSLMTYMMNLILSVFETTATAVFGVYFKLQSFFFMPIFGLNNGLIPVIAYNYGAKKKERIDEGLKTAVVAAFSVMLIGTIVFELFAANLLGLFAASDRMLEIGVPALRIICLGFPLAGIAIALSSVFQAFSLSYYSLIISVGRQLVVLIPVAWLFSKTGNINLVWTAFPIAEAVSFVLSIIFFRIVYARCVTPMRDN